MSFLTSQDRPTYLPAETPESPTARRKPSLEYSMEELDGRRDFFQLTPRDAETMLALRPFVEEHAVEIVRGFYDFLLQFPGTRDLLQDPAIVRRLLESQRQYLLEMFGGKYDMEYCRRKVFIGETHYRLGLEPKWYIGTYLLYQRLLYPLLQAHLAELGKTPAEITEALLTVSKLMNFDMQFALEAYFNALHEAVVREKEQLEMLTAQLQTANDQLGMFNIHLEEQVKERTTALQSSQEQLLQSEKLAAVGKIASQMAHEIRNPLSAIVLNLDLLSDEIEAYSTDTSEAKRLLQSVVSQVGKMNSTIREYLQAARMPQVRPELADVNAVIEDQTDFMQPELKRAKITLRLRLTPTLPQVMLDSEQIRQVMLNLVKNSVDAMPDGGVLAIATGEELGQVVISISDAGRGIAPANLNRIFQPLFTTKEKGLGMGLTFVQEVIRAHRGHISCKSELGKGTTFTLYFPIPSDMEEGPPQEVL